MASTRKPRVPLQEQIRLINECRKSGMTDADWCRENDITPSTFYNWLSRCRKIAADQVPQPSYGHSEIPRPKQDVVPVSIVRDQPAKPQDISQSYAIRSGNFAITAADAVSRRYKSNDPEAIIAQRAIKIKDIRFCEELLGFYTVLLNCEYIGINPNCSKQQRRSALAHELGHAIFDRKHAASGQAFQDTYFYSLSNAKAERRANTERR